jgi:hypothetical protein
MPTSNAFKADLVRLIGEIPDKSTLPQAQFAYRQMIFFMGLRILEAFPEAAIGPVESEDMARATNAPAGGEHGGGGHGGGRGPETEAGGGGQSGGGHINTVVKIAGIVLCLKEPKPPK